MVMLRSDSDCLHGEARGNGHHQQCVPLRTSADWDCSVGLGAELFACRILWSFLYRIWSRFFQFLTISNDLGPTQFGPSLATLRRIRANENQHLASCWPTEFGQFRPNFDDVGRTCTQFGQLLVKFRRCRLNLVRTRDHLAGRVQIWALSTEFGSNLVDKWPTFG